MLPLPSLKNLLIVILCIWYWGGNVNHTHVWQSEDHRWSLVESILPSHHYVDPRTQVSGLVRQVLCLLHRLSDPCTCFSMLSSSSSENSGREAISRKSSCSIYDIQRDYKRLLFFSELASEESLSQLSFPLCPPLWHWEMLFSGQWQSEVHRPAQLFLDSYKPT